MQAVRLRFGPAAAVMLLHLAAGAQGTAPATYSSSPEYRQMVEELHQPSPSTIFIATGKRPQADPALQPTVKETADQLTIETAAVRYTFERASGRFTMNNKQSGAVWTLNAPACPSSAVSVSRSGNVWTFSAPGQCEGTSLTLTLFTGALAKLDLRRSGAADKELTFHVEGGGPYFGLGERFWQAGLTSTQLDARPQDRYGEPGHNWAYMGIPLLYTTGGLGLFADTARDLQFAVNSSDTGLDVRSASNLVPLYLFSELDPKGLLSAYTALTGRPPDPPLWEFGFGLRHYKAKEACSTMRIVCVSTAYRPVRSGSMTSWTKQTI